MSRPHLPTAVAQKVLESSVRLDRAAEGACKTATHLSDSSQKVGGCFFLSGNNSFLETFMDGQFPSKPRTFYQKHTHTHTRSVRSRCGSPPTPIAPTTSHYRLCRTFLPAPFRTPPRAPAWGRVGPASGNSMLRALLAPNQTRCAGT